MDVTMLEVTSGQWTQQPGANTGSCGGGLINVPIIGS